MNERSKIRLTEISQKGTLPTELSQTMPDRQTVFIWWLGQAGFAVRYADFLMMIDPYLSDSLAKKYQGERIPAQPYDAAADPPGRGSAP